MWRFAMLVPRLSRSAGTFSKHYFVSDGERYAYRLYIPAGASTGQPLPVMVMLHGCKQDSEDFARGTGMNHLADEHRFLVVYPEQRQKANAMRCWNWFEPAHQARGKGEPAMIASLAAHVVAAHHGDGARVYLAGLSAGVPWRRWPGSSTRTCLPPWVCIGLAPGAAADMPGAFSAMRKGRPGAPAAASAAGTGAAPTIHGTADTTVHPRNADHVLQASLAGLRARGLVLSEVHDPEGTHPPGGRPAQRTVWATPDGTPVVGALDCGRRAARLVRGSAAGLFTDPQGPSASHAMVAFFLRHRRGT